MFIILGFLINTNQYIIHIFVEHFTEYFHIISLNPQKLLSPITEKQTQSKRLTNLLKDIRRQQRVNQYTNPCLQT